jgi:hypothetical protein
MRLVILESPYACKTPGLGYHARAMKVQENIGYARACLRDSLLRGEAPIASHLLYTQSGVLDDDVEAERKMGIEAGLAWGKHADASVFYLDHGFSSGMGLGLVRAYRERRQIEFRMLGRGVPSSLSTRTQARRTAGSFQARTRRRYGCATCTARTIWTAWRET